MSCSISRPFDPPLKPILIRSCQRLRSKTDCKLPHHPRVSSRRAEQLSHRKVFIPANPFDTNVRPNGELTRSSKQDCVVFFARWNSGTSTYHEQLKITTRQSFFAFLTSLVITIFVKYVFASCSSAYGELAVQTFESSFSTTNLLAAEEATLDRQLTWRADAFWKQTLLARRLQANHQIHLSCVLGRSLDLAGRLFAAAAVVGYVSLGIANQDLTDTSHVVFLGLVIKLRTANVEDVYAAKVIPHRANASNCTMGSDVNIRNALRAEELCGIVN